MWDWRITWSQPRVEKMQRKIGDAYVYAAVALFPSMMPRQKPAEDSTKRTLRGAACGPFNKPAGEVPRKMRWIGPGRGYVDPVLQ
jgi:hypothetical protein